MIEKQYSTSNMKINGTMNSVLDFFELNAYSLSLPSIASFLNGVQLNYGYGFIHNMNVSNVCLNASCDYPSSSSYIQNAVGYESARYKPSIIFGNPVSVSSEVVFSNGEKLYFYDNFLQANSSSSYPMFLILYDVFENKISSSYQISSPNLRIEAVGFNEYLLYNYSTSQYYYLSNSIFEEVNSSVSNLLNQSCFDIINQNIFSISSYSLSIVSSSSFQITFDIIKYNVLNSSSSIYSYTVPFVCENTNFLRQGYFSGIYISFLNDLFMFFLFNSSNSNVIFMNELVRNVCFYNVNQYSNNYFTTYLSSAPYSTVASSMTISVSNLSLQIGNSFQTYPFQVSLSMFNNNNYITNFFYDLDNVFCVNIGDFVNINYPPSGYSLSGVNNFFDVISPLTNQHFVFQVSDSLVSFNNNYIGYPYVMQYMFPSLPFAACLKTSLFEMPLAKLHLVLADGAGNDYFSNIRNFIAGPFDFIDTMKLVIGKRVYEAYHYRLEVV